MSSALSSARRVPCPVPVELLSDCHEEQQNPAILPILNVLQSVCFAACVFCRWFVL
jgi:hypothetical protein